MDLHTGAQRSRWIGNRVTRAAVAVILTVSTTGGPILAQGPAATPPAAASVAVRNAALLDLIPAESLFVAMWSGTQTPEFKSSKSGKVLASPQWKKFWTDLVPKAIATAGQPEQVKQYGQFLDVLKLATDRPLACYMVLPREAPDPIFVAMVDGGSNPDAVAAEIDKTLTLLEAERPPAMYKVGNVLVMASVERDRVPDVGKHLVESPGFVSAVKSLGKPMSITPAAFVYVDIATPLATLPARVGADEGVVKTVIDGSGVMGLKSFLLRAGFDARGEWASEAILEAPAADRKGMLATLLSPRTGPDPLISRVPADAIAFGTVHFDLPTLLKQGIDLATEINPQTPEQLEFVWSKVTAFTGVKIREDLLDQLGTDSVMYEVPSVAKPTDKGASTSSSVVVIHKARDAKKVFQSIYLATKSVQNFLVMQGKSSPQLPKLTLNRASTPDGATVLSINIKFSEATLAQAPMAASFGDVAVAEKDGLVFFGTTEAVRQALVPPSSNITTASTYRDLLTRLGSPANASVGFYDLPRSVGAFKAQLMEVVDLIEKQHALEVDARPMITAIFDAVQPQIAPGGQASWTDDAGYHFRSVVPFPGGEVFARTGGSSGSVGGAALGASILLPSLNRARETANRVKSASNLRQIGMACMLYANEHDHKYPPDMGTLLKTEDITIDVFLSPRTSTSIPASVKSGDVDAMTKWVDASGDFKYLGAGLSDSAAPEVVLAHERLDRKLADGINVLFADGHVEFILLKEWPQIEKASKEALEKK